MPKEVSKSKMPKEVSKSNFLEQFLTEEHFMQHQERSEQPFKDKNGNPIGLEKFRRMKAKFEKEKLEMAKPKAPKAPKLAKAPKSKAKAKGKAKAKAKSVEEKLS